MTNDKVVKLSDFGLTRNTSDNNYYRLSRKGIYQLVLRFFNYSYIMYKKLLSNYNYNKFKVL